ncbi:hypothetical protein FSARC_8464 [Fusarium sarcochroum]|uniref:Clr5 domain-containing protein n=1 Tax=Fusarium sarcochroum TaxID=1208366 RepID=A0A8H4X695_9HYPO|nr:hypothetical protein FSARC_8464 [Fusarium sarcochroum]
MSRAPVIPDTTWDRHKNIIRALYLDQDKSPGEISELLWEQYGFSASRHQLIRRLAKWKFKKYTTKAEWVSAGSQIQSRREQQGKETELLFNGKTVPTKKLEKALDRYIGPWDFGPQCQKIVPEKALATLAARTPVQNTGIETCTTPWIRFWTRAEETVFTSDAIASIARPHNQESLDMVLSSMSNSKQTFTKPSELLSYLETVLPQPEGSHRNITEENHDSFYPVFLIQWTFYACSNNLVDQTCLTSLLKWITHNDYLELMRQAIALGGLTVQAFSSCFIPSAAEMGDQDLLLFLLNSSGGTAVARRDLAKALDVAIGKLDASMVDLLLRNGANPNGPPSCFQGPLKRALGLHDGAIIVERLLKAGANCQDGQSLPSLLLRARTVTSVSLLLAAGAAVDHTGRFSCSPIQKAASRNDLGMANLLLNANANPNLIRFDTKYLSLDYLSGRELSGYCDIFLAVIPPISLAAGYGNVEMVERLLEAGAEVNVFKLVNIQLHNLIDEKARALINYTKEKKIPMPHDIFQYLRLLKQSPLQACLSATGVNPTERRKIAELLLQSDVDIHAPASYWQGRTALQAAAEIEDCHLIDTLIKNGANVNEAPAADGGLTALQAASLSGNIMLVKWLIQQGANIHAQPAMIRGFTCFQAASASGNLELVNLLLQMRAEVNALATTPCFEAYLTYDSGGFLQHMLVNQPRPADYPGAASALYHAAYTRNYDLCALLLREDALTDLGDMPSPLIAAVFRGSHVIVSRLLDAQAEPNACTQLVHWEKAYGHTGNFTDSHSEYWTPLVAACYWSDARMIELLLHDGAHPNVKGLCRYSPLQASLCREDFKLDILQFLLSYLSSTKTKLRLDDCQSLVGLAVAKGLPAKVIQLLISRGATMGLSTSGKHPMYWTVKCRQGKQRQDVINLLLKANLAPHEVHYQAEGKGQALILAAKEGLNEMVEMLLDAGADINYCVPRSNDMTALQVACREGHVSVAEYLLSRGAETDILSQGINGSTTALADAAANGHFNLVVLLLEHRAAVDPNMFNEWRPPLARAAAAGRLDIVHLLLEADSKHNSLGDLYRLARYAEDCGHQVVANMIREWEKI